MSISMEDLCASLSSSHVGQEAMDLAALQVQLAQTLFCQSMTSSAASQRQDDCAHQPCNTPTGRTPSASFSWSPMAMVDSRRNPDHVRDEMEEDERMVEDLLIPTSPMSSPMSAKPQTPAGRSQQTSPMSQPDTSLFTTTDPFYMAQLQAAQNYGVSQPSVFSQSAFPSQQSPFIIHSSFQRHNPTQNPLSLDTHSILMAATSSFDR